MPERHTVRFRSDLHVFADGVEPFGDAGKQLDSAPEGNKILTVDAYAPGLGLLVHEMHVSDERIGGVFARQPVGLRPKGLGVLAYLRQERVFLHRPWRESAVEIVNERDGLLV